MQAVAAAMTGEVTSGMPGSMGPMGPPGPPGNNHINSLTHFYNFLSDQYVILFKNQGTNKNFWVT